MTTPDISIEDPNAIPPTYDAASTERALYAEWEAAGVFTANAARSTRTGGPRDPFTIVIPPPNVTAILHVGHGLNNTVQDVLIRWRRMAGDEALWVPGTDHAGIATQNVVEKQLAAEGKTRDDLGRDAFVERVKEFVDLTGGQILQQLRAIGASADWTRTAYTLSPELSRAVREVFVRLYDDQLIYRGHRVIHWCPRCLTSLSDEEAEFEDETGALYHVRYPLADDPTRSLTVATTRPETLPGDVAIAVHPDDPRYASLVGTMVTHPLNGLLIPIIADTYVDPAFGTGALKITPALEAVKEGTIRILPERHEAVYVNWLTGIRDWNISRQLWWGHRIPVWRCEACGFEKAYREDPSACEQCASPKFHQDPDVLDTWFSSWLWPLSTLGWPNETADLKAFYPTDVLVTAPEILFFWVARMIMAGFYIKKETPFHTVYLHGTVRDMQHRKMSKSLGNGVDPIDVVNQFGADALRYTLMQGMGLGVDVMLDPNDLEKSFAPGRNFATKLWNIGRFLLMQVGSDPVQPFASVDAAAFTSADRWILARLNLAIAECDASLGPVRPSAANGGRWTEAERNAGMRLDAYAESARRFVWNELADWYIEAAKSRLQAGGDDREVARTVLVHVFDQALRLLHPLMPFITEALWRRLPGYVEGTFVARASWPTAALMLDGAEAFDAVRDAIGAIRQLRADYAIPPGQKIAAHLVSSQASAVAPLLAERALIARLARAELSTEPAPTGANAHAVLPSGIELVLPLAGVVDLEKEVARLGTELGGLTKQLDALRGRLSNEKFTGKAPPELVAAERAKEQEWAVRAAQLAAKIRALGGTA